MNPDEPPWEPPGPGQWTRRPEPGIPAVVGVPGLVDRARDGDLVRVDPVAGAITVLDRAT